MRIAAFIVLALLTGCSGERQLGAARGAGVGASVGAVGGPLGWLAGMVLGGGVGAAFFPGEQEAVAVTTLRPPQPLRSSDPPLPEVSPD